MYYHHPAADVQPEKGSVEEATVNSFKFQICNHTSPGTKKIWFSRRLTLEMIKLCRTAARLSPVDTTPCFRFVIAASASPRGRLLLPFRVRLARGTGFPNRHRSRTCGPPGTYGADTGQPRESTVQTLRSAVMRRVAAGGKLECVFPWKLAPSITRTGRASEKPGLTKPPTAAYRRGAVAVSRCLARTHCLS